MKILVTGSKGMIGSRLVESLLAAGHFVVGIDVVCTETIEDNYCQYRVDLADKEKLQKIIGSGKIDRIIHLAGLAHTEGESNLTWERYEYVNIKCAKNVFEIAEDRPVLFISTVDVFGFYDGRNPVDESSPIKPVTNYGKSKALAEVECKKVKHFSIFRFSPVYTDEIKRDIQKRYYLKYPNIAYRIGTGSEYEVLDVKKAVKAMADWCEVEPKNDVTIIKDEKNMWTPDCIKVEKENGRARFVLKFPKKLIHLGYAILKGIFGENEKVYLLNKAVYPLRSK